MQEAHQCKTALQGLVNVIEGNGERDERTVKQVNDALDAMLTPCLRMSPPSVVGPGAPEDDPGRAFRRVDQGLVAITHNFCSIPVPSVALPTAARHAPSGLPAGVLLWGAPREDRQVLSLAMGLELLFAEKKSNVPVTA